MSAASSWAIERGIYQTLANSTDVTALLGGARIYDDPPQAAALPYINLGQSELRDWSTGSEDGGSELHLSTDLSHSECAA